MSIAQCELLEKSGSPVDGGGCPIHHAPYAEVSPFSSLSRILEQELAYESRTDAE